MRSRDTIAVGWIDPGQVDGAFMLSVAHLYAEHPQVTSLVRIVACGLISRGRNQMVAGFLQGGCDWLLILDSDMRFKQGRELRDFDALRAAAHETERPIVAGLYFGAWPGEFYPQPVPLIFQCQTGSNSRFVPILTYPDNRVIPVDSAGTGCLLVHRSVFEKIRDTSPLPEHQGENWCWFQDMPINRDWFSEDHWFCARAREAGYRLHAHTGVVLEHHKSFWISDKQYVKPEVSDGVRELRRSSPGEQVPVLRMGDDREAADPGDDLPQASGA